MPTISLRLTDEEHAALREWAFGARRSIQREIVFRLFEAPAVSVASSSANAASQAKVQFTTRPDDHFKPDPK